MKKLTTAICIGIVLMTGLILFTMWATVESRKRVQCYHSMTPKECTKPTWPEVVLCKLTAPEGVNCN